ncbi:MAG: AAA family ATPase [Rhodoferax sp.]|nr:AAA family ATPase [Rhodoferax sp.]
MFPQSLSFPLPEPWQQTTFSTSRVGFINFLVGPNGSGKSRFAANLRGQLPNSRLLGTDRLSGMEQNNSLRNIFGDHFSGGLAKEHFSHFKNAGQQGMGIDTIVLLEERMDLRIQVEATLSHLFNRKIRLEWDSGKLQAFASIGTTGNSYRLDRDECHGIKELFVLLTHLYDDEHQYLIIDEPELNLHPQFQAFFMHEVRKVAGSPTAGTNKKIIFLITHSPFILDFRSIQDVKSVISFSSTHLPPRQLFDLDESTSTRLTSLVPRLNVHHKQLFFSDNPIFVEGILDAQLLANLQEARGVSVAGAGSCIIDAGGCEEVNRYLELCLILGKTAHFVYDLDSLFSGNLRACVRSDEQIQHFLAAAGVGSDFSRYCGELDRALTRAIDTLLDLPITNAAHNLLQLLHNSGPKADWQTPAIAKARVAVLTAISRFRSEVVAMLDSASVAGIEGRLAQLVQVLRLKNVHLLAGGTLERYLPSYSGDPYVLPDDQKRLAVAAELDYLSAIRTEKELATRYTDLFAVSNLLPGKVNVDLDTVLRDYLSRFIHELQSALISNSAWELPQLQNHLAIVQKNTSKVFSVISLTRPSTRQFQAQIRIAELLGGISRVVEVTHQTNAGMGEFILSPSGSVA